MVRPGQLFQFAYSNVYFHFAARHTWRITLLSRRFCGWVFFPIGGDTGVSQVSPSAAPSWGKNTTAVFGVHGRRSSGQIYPLTYRVLKGVCKCKLQTKSGFILRSFQKWRASLSAASLGRSACLCQKQ